MSQDPIGLMGGLNAYSYPTNPVSWVDPLGLETLELKKVEEIIKENNNSGVSDDMLLCLAWKETSFDAAAKNKTSTATGLMQMTKGAVTDVNNNYKSIGPFNHGDMTNGKDAVAAGSAYIKLRIKWAKGDIEKGLDGFGTGKGYSTSIKECSECITECGKNGATCQDKQSCLDKIHK